MNTVMKIISFLMVSMQVSCLYPLFNYDKAVYAGQQGKWDAAHAALMPLVVDNSDDPSMLYDVGVTSYKLEDYDHARAYFDAASIHKKATVLLKEQAYFNAGNAAVKQKKLHDAVDKYEQVLAINPENERAQHNLAAVKKMLEQQKQEKNEQDKDQKKDKKEKKENKDQQKDKPDDQPEDQKGDQEDKNGQDKEKDQQDNNKKQGAQESKSRDKKNGNEQERTKKQDDLNQESEQKKQHQEKQEQSEKEQGQAHAGKKAQDESFDKVDAWLASILKKREQEDAALNKQMIKASVGKQLAGHDGQNCW